MFWSNIGDEGWRATNCSIFPTINTYAARIKDATLEELLVDLTFLQDISTQFEQPPVRDQDLDEYKSTWTYMTTTNATIRDGKWESCEGSESSAFGLPGIMKHSDEPSYVNRTGYTNPSAGWKWWYFSEDCVWFVDGTSSTVMKDTLRGIFDGQNLTKDYGIKGSIHLLVLFEEGKITHDSIDKRMESLATSMTSNIRNNGALSSRGSTYTTQTHAASPDMLSQPAKGKMWVTTTCVYIRWRWIASPAIMIGLTGVFLLLVALENRGIKNDRLWKSSFLAALFCEVEVPKTPLGKQEMKAVAKSSSASLEGKSGRLKLVAG
jgi:hypothetical protein